MIDYRYGKEDCPKCGYGYTKFLNMEIEPVSARPGCRQFNVFAVWNCRNCWTRYSVPISSVYDTKNGKLGDY